MSFSKYVPPRRKKRVFCSKESPFPVPVESITQETASADTWFYYTAYLMGKNVLVRHSGDINFLYKMGFFGKGNLSRSQPEFNHRFRTARVPHQCDTHDIIQPRVQSRRVYKQHVSWSKQDGDKDDDSSNHTDTSDSEEGSMDCQANCASPAVGQNPVQEPSTNSHLGDCENLNKDQSQCQEGESEFWTSANADSKKPEVSWDSEADPDFWGMSDGSSVKNQLAEDPWSVDNEDSDFWNSEGKALVSDEQEVHEKWGRNDKEMRTNTSRCNSKIDDENSVLSVIVQEEPENESCYKKCSENIHFVTERSISNIHMNEVNKASVKSLKNTGENVDQKCDGQIGILKEGQDDPDPACFDPICQDDDIDGDVLVIDDSDIELKKTRKPSRRKKWRPVLKRDPHPVLEHLQLSFEETFFLSYGLGCLVVLDEKQSRLNLSSLWNRFCSAQANFLPNYIAYHYYRSKGWVPKTGLKFGCDFIVYKEGPPFYHGSYSVIVRLLDEETLRENPKYTNRNMSWISLSGLNRITEHVAKELLLCYVIKPRGITEENLHSPACIPQFKVQEILVSRWVSSQERQEKELEEFP